MLMMSDKGVVIPTWAIPLVVSLFVGAISYGAAQANAETTTKEVKRNEVIVKETAKKAQENGQAQAVTETKVDAIVESLARQEKIQEKTNDQISALVQALLAQ
jgi:DNA-binding transcriptional regulator GbsR (MarR family)